MTSIRKSYISKSAKRIETITCRKFLKYLLRFNEESKRKLLNLILAALLKIMIYTTLRTKISIIHA